MNLYYRCHVIHEDIRSVCYTIFDRRPQRAELSRSSSLMQAMHWVDQQVAKQAAVLWVDPDSTRQTDTSPAQASQPALL